MSKKYIFELMTDKIFPVTGLLRKPLSPTASKVEVLEPTLIHCVSIMLEITCRSFNKTFCARGVNESETERLR